MDIFDRIMHIRPFNLFEAFYIKHKEVLLYFFFGGLTFAVSVCSYVLINVHFGINELIANILSWILAVLFAYFTNRTWVFQSIAETVDDYHKEIISFFGGRILTLVIEEVILLIFMTILGLNSIVVKIVAQIVVIALNYFISKLLVFRDRK